MPVNEQVVNAVTAANFKAIGEAQAVYMNLAIGNAVAHQQAMNQLSAALVAKATEMIGTTDISEAGGLVALLQQAMKVASSSLRAASWMRWYSRKHAAHRFMPLYGFQNSRVRNHH